MTVTVVLMLMLEVELVVLVVTVVTVVVTVVVVGRGRWRGVHYAVAGGGPPWKRCGGEKLCSAVWFKKILHRKITKCHDFGDETQCREIDL